MDEQVELDDGTTFRWPFCQVTGCTNRICLAKGETRFCWPHSSSNKSLGKMIRNANKTRRTKQPASA